eukprot:COSAG02_NODE_1422_length_12685_cov_69.610361_9_plen_181_part_00
MHYCQQVQQQLIDLHPYEHHLRQRRECLSQVSYQGVSWGASSHPSPSDRDGRRRAATAELSRSLRGRRRRPLVARVRSPAGPAAVNRLISKFLHIVSSYEPIYSVFCIQIPENGAWWRVLLYLCAPRRLRGRRARDARAARRRRGRRADGVHPTWRSCHKLRALPRGAPHLLTLKLRSHH